jgi:hypothetical protein
MLPSPELRCFRAKLSFPARLRAAPSTLSLVRFPIQPGHLHTLDRALEIWIFFFSLEIVFGPGGREPRARLSTCPDGLVCTAADGSFFGCTDANQSGSSAHMPAYPLPFWAHLTSSRAIAPPESAHLRKAQGSSTVTLRLAFGDFFWRSDSVQQAAAGQGCYPSSATAYHPIDDAPLHRSLGSHLAVVAADPIPTVPSKRLGSRLRTTVWIRYAHTATNHRLAL